MSRHKFADLYDEYVSCNQERMNAGLSCMGYAEWSEFFLSRREGAQFCAFMEVTAC